MSAVLGFSTQRSVEMGAQALQIETQALVALQQRVNGPMA